MNNKLTFLIPTYDAETHLENNLVMWKELSGLVSLLFVEDSLEEKSREIVEKIGGRYFSKTNGNWGSVVNYAIEEKLVVTEYVAVVDPDDTINISELIKLIEKLNGKDLYVSDQFNKNVSTGEMKFQSSKKHIYIHNSWIRTEVFNSIDKLPEKTSYTDVALMYEILSKAKNMERTGAYPYIYHIGFPNQSMALTFEKIKSQYKGINQIAERDYSKKSVSEMRKYLRRIRVSAKYVLAFLLRIAYRSETKENRKEIRKMFRENFSFIKPVTTWLVWEKLSLFFGGTHE